jgi:hydroxymethylpyrimidine pyrophosphatase-like HAD family hydrolase
MNEPAIALIALDLDLDRTLFQSDGSVSARTLSAIDACRRKGLHIAIATARPFASVQTFLPEARHRDVPWVCGSGASIYENEQCVYADLIAVDVAQRVVELLYAIDADFIFSLEMNGKLYVNRPVPGRITPHEACDLRQIVTDPVAKFLINLDDPYQDKIQLPDLPPGCKVQLTDQGTRANILSPTVSKSHALQFVLEQRGLDK